MADVEEININDTVDSIAGDLGLKGDTGTDETTETVDTDATTETAASETTTAETVAKTEAAVVVPAARAAPKSWAHETHGLWAKIPPEAQAQIEHREKQMIDGLKQYTDAAKEAKVYQDVLTPYMELIKAQRIEAPQAIKYLMEGHRQLSTGTQEQRAAYLAGIAKSYGIDFAKAAAVASASADEPASLKELRERTERLERARQHEMDAAQRDTAERIGKQVSNFAEAKDDKGAAKHPYFDECSEDIVALVNAGHTLEQAYEKSVYANPVTRAKELERVRKADEEALRAKAKDEAEKARNSSRTNVNSRDTRRAPTASKANGWEDTLDETMQVIKARTN